MKDVPAELPPQQGHTPSITDGDSKERAMNEETEKLYAKLAALEKETANLWRGSIVTGRRYSEAQVQSQ